MIRNIVVLAQAANDIESEIDFYNAIQDGVGRYFRGSTITDLRQHGAYFGEHRIHLSFFRALSSRFPYAIYSRDKDELEFKFPSQCRSHLSNACHCQRRVDRIKHPVHGSPARRHPHRKWHYLYV